MADIQRVPIAGLLKNKSDLLVAIGVIMAVMMLIIPIPAILLDTFMSFNLLLSILIILIVLFTKKALEFSVFPAMLLVTTIFGLGLNVSSTRMILTQGENFSGRIVRAFATFVVGTSGTEGLVVGFVIFIILIAVQFIVITKGSTRVAEVAARFTLDSLPGKQMAIEASYNSGAITEEEAAKQKSELQKEADFYGAMDGASKFVSGNVKIGLLITVVNVVAGIIVGVAIHGEDIGSALVTYISLTVGDGLVSQIPALLVSTATGLIVTRAISDGTFGGDVKTQFSAQAKIYWIAAVFLVFLAILPGFPFYILLPMAGLIGYVGFRLSRKESVQKTEADTAAAESAANKRPVEIAPVVPLDPLSLELGYGLIPLVDKDQGAELLDRITRIRRESALELGLVVPMIRIIDNMRLEPSEYCIKIKGVEVGKGSIRVGHYMAINPGSASDDIPGDPTSDPAFGLPALWITDEYRDRAERAGYTVVDSPSIIATHITEIIKKHAHELLGRQEMQSILDTLKNDYPAVVDEVTKSLSLGEIQKVLQGLLIERVSIRNMITVLESVADYAPVSKDPGFLIEKARQALKREICLQYAENKTLHVMTLHPDIEQTILDARVDTASGPVAAVEPGFQRKWINSLANAVKNIQNIGHYPVLLCQEASRSLVKNSTARDLPDIAVLSVPEISRDIKVESLGQVVLDE